jgi:hypothetical protein
LEPEKRHLDFSLNVMCGAMGIRQPDDAVDFEMDEFYARRLTTQLTCRGRWRHVEPRNAVMRLRSGAAFG